MGDTVSVPGAGECGVLAFALSNADPNYWWATAPVSPNDGTANVGMLFMPSSSLYMQVCASFSVEGDAVRVSRAYMRTGSSPTSITGASHVFHLRGVAAVVG